MRLIHDWQYKMIEKSLYNYENLDISKPTDASMKFAIESTLHFFKGSMHETMLKEFYFEAAKHRKKYTNVGHYAHVCINLLNITEPNGYVVRREIIYRIAMICFALGLFKVK